MVLIDTHVNLHAAAFDADRAAVIARARAAGVGPMLTICDRLDNIGAVAAVAASAPNIWMSVGVHPHYAKDHPDLSAQALVALALAHPRCIALGETGLDQHYGYSPIDQQEAALRAHIAAARALDLPVIIHTREADALMGDVLEDEYRRGPFRILMHCYTSGADLARRALALGAYFALSGIFTFKTAEDVRAVARLIPLDRLMLETDSPYLAPPPHRGRRNEPAFLREVHAYFCQWAGLEEEEVAARMEQNFYNLFSKAHGQRAQAGASYG